MYTNQLIKKYKLNYILTYQKKINSKLNKI